MEIRSKDEIVLNEDEAILFGSTMFGLIKGIDEKRAEGMYINKEEKELYEMAKDILEQLEDSDVM